MSSLRNIFNETDLNVLATFNQETHYLAIDTKEGRHSIVAIEKKTVTCWEKCKALFNQGFLGHKKIHLTEVTQHLATYRIDLLRNAWAFVETSTYTDPQHILQKNAYMTVCSLADKVEKKSRSLFANKLELKKLLDKTYILRMAYLPGGISRWEQCNPLHFPPQSLKKLAQDYINFEGIAPMPSQNN